MQIKTKKDLMKSEIYQKVVDRLRSKRGGVPSPSTEKSFSLYIFSYCKFYSKEKGLKHIMSPDDIMDERKADYQTNENDVRRKHEEVVVKFINFLGNQKVRGGERSSSGRVSNALIAIRALYRANYRPLIEVTAPAVIPKRTYKVPTQEELRKAVESIEYDSVFKTYVLVAKDCGASPQDILSFTGNEESVKFGTVKEQLRKGQIPIHLHFIRGKTFTKGLGFYDTFLGEESVSALQKLLKRRRYNKMLRIGQRTIEKRFQSLNEELGWTGFYPTSLRKYFNTNLKLAECNEAIVEYMMGHSLSRVKAAYLVEALRQQPEKLMEIYVKYYPVLKIWK